MEPCTMSLNKSPDVIPNAISFPFYSLNESLLIDLVKTFATRVSALLSWFLFRRPAVIDRRDTSLSSHISY